MGQCCEIQESAQKAQTSGAPISMHAQHADHADDSKLAFAVAAFSAPSKASHGASLPKPVVAVDEVVEENNGNKEIRPAVNNPVTEKLLERVKAKKKSRVKQLTESLREYVRKMPKEKSDNEDEDPDIRIAQSLMREDVVDRKGSAFSRIVGQVFVKLKAKREVQQREQCRQMEKVISSTTSQNSQSSSSPRCNHSPRSHRRSTTRHSSRGSADLAVDAFAGIGPSPRTHRKSANRHSSDDSPNCSPRGYSDLPAGVVGVHRYGNGKVALKHSVEHHHHGHHGDFEARVFSKKGRESAIGQHGHNLTHDWQASSHVPSPQAQGA
eukprot:gnl/TRDRNA2_/TRDRNA2_72349_c0_seq2.p1 gnl/TRDRNA2_/TRDRNA2_72349_c0~~gnl/TRDRNA2_/TRDRNA2_72349_c0_seq2.p1  ORF type:complete len:324 (-),score=30.41 gnl/TRDRNA2_/TRDRNA2_72349_c0_seq2:96-1067(-)